MKRTLLLALPLLTAQLASAQSAVPNAISYQGRVADANGILVGDASPVNRKVTLRLYDAATAANPIYSEEQTVTINKGVFSVLLGQGLQVGSEPRPAIASVFNGSERFLGVTVDDGGPAADPEITPRQQIVSTAFAFRARDAEVAGSVQQASGTSNMNWLNVNNFTSNGHTKITGSNVLELGTGVAKGASNGMIGYQAFSQGLDIVGAGTRSDYTDRRITMHAQGGTEFLGPIFFGNRTAQHINLWGNTFGLGIQNSTLYNRSAGNFAWYQGGNHGDAELDSGGGVNLAVLNGNGLTVNTGGVRINGGGRFEGTLDRGGHGIFAMSFGGGHSYGSQDWTTYARTSELFAWYLNGAHAGGRLDAGGGSTLMTLSAGGLSVASGALTMGSGPVNFGNRLGQHLNLWGQEYGLGVQGGTLYNRSGANYSWFVGGSHRDNGGDAANGQLLSNWNNDRIDFYRRIWSQGNVEGNDLLARGWTYTGEVAYRDFDGASRWRTRGSGPFEVVYNNDWKFRVDGNGRTFTNSDRVLKRDVKLLSGAIGTVMKLKPSTYHFKKDDAKQPLSYGFIAQEVQEVLPDLVSKPGDGVLGVNYDGLIPVAVAAIQEQQKLIEKKDVEIAELKKELAAARETNSRQDTRLAAIEKALDIKAAAVTPPATEKKESKVASRR